MDYKLKKSRSYFQKSSTPSYKPIQDQVLGFLSVQRFKNKTFDIKLFQTQCTVLLWRPSPHIWVKKNISCFKSSDPVFLYFPMFTQKIRLTKIINMKGIDHLISDQGQWSVIIRDFLSFNCWLELEIISRITPTAYQMHSGNIRILWYYNMMYHNIIIWNIMILLYRILEYKNGSNYVYNVYYTSITF